MEKFWGPFKELVTDKSESLDRTDAGSARVLGVHLEGPFINPGRLGAQPNAVRSGSIEELSTLHALARIRVLTLAPEISGHLDFIRELKIAGIIPQIGHSNGSYEEGVAALDAGVHGIGKKLVEEAAEAWMAAEHEGPERAAEEISQLLYWTQALMLAKGLTLDDVYAHL